jgi:hypothetical protein
MSIQLDPEAALEPSPGERLRIALDLFELGEDVMRQNLRRAHPGETAEQIEERLSQWLLTRPGAEHGDGVGRARSLPSI